MKTNPPTFQKCPGIAYWRALAKWQQSQSDRPAPMAATLPENREALQNSALREILRTRFHGNLDLAWERLKRLEDVEQIYWVCQWLRQQPTDRTKPFGVVPDESFPEFFHTSKILDEWG